MEWGDPLCGGKSLGPKGALVKFFQEEMRVDGPLYGLAGYGRSVQLLASGVHGQGFAEFA